jgi:wyosine [tRNA(Phe)-imidazoG37] synthetase (radical SAM superfamily)
MVLPIKQSIIYGPVDSRRLGKSLGINLMPQGRKYCDFDCLYCHYGRTVIHKYRTGPEDNFPSVDEVLSEVERYLKSDVEYGYLTFSGNGEPTLHPEFDEIARECKDLLAKLRPYVKLTLLSNSSTCGQDHIIKALEYIDLPIMKLDAGSDELFRKINRPVDEIKFDNMLENLAAMDEPTIQTLFLTGEPDNSSPEAVNQWYECLNRIKPKSVQIYTLDRPFARRTGQGRVNIEKVDNARMEEITYNGRKKYGLEISRY